MNNRLQYKLKGARLRRYAFYSNPKIRFKIVVEKIQKNQGGLF